MKYFVSTTATTNASLLLCLWNEIEIDIFLFSDDARYTSKKSKYIFTFILKAVSSFLKWHAVITINWQFIVIPDNGNIFAESSLWAFQRVFKFWRELWYTFSVFPCNAFVVSCQKTVQIIWIHCFSCFKNMPHNCIKTTFSNTKNPFTFLYPSRASIARPHCSSRTGLVVSFC